MPSSVDDFDVIVVGAGAAGVCCAGELVLHGLRPLLVAESRDVGYHFRPKVMDNGRAPAQLPTRNLYGEGGWWYSLAQRLNVPIKVHRNQAGIATTLLGSGVVKDIPYIVAAAELSDMLAGRSPVPLGGGRGILDRVLHTGLAMAPDELAALHDVSFAEWVVKLGADDVVTRICLDLATSSSYLPRHDAENLLSVFGVFCRLRSYFCGLAEMYSIEPDPRQGLFVPVAAEIERRGGTVWRGRHVARVLTEGETATGIVMDDSTEARAPIVALAAGSSRLSSLFPDAVPPEVEAVQAFEEALGEYREYTSFTIVDRSFYQPPRQVVSTTNDTGTRIQADWSISSFAPWVTRPGWEMIATQVVRSRPDVEAEGGVEALYARMRDVSDSLYPGFKNALVEQATEQHAPFVTPFLIGPKLPRMSPSLRRLWFVGEGSAPVDGVYVEGAASAGVLGARSIVRATR